VSEKIPKIERTRSASTHITTHRHTHTHTHTKDVPPCFHVLHDLVFRLAWSLWRKEQSGPLQGETEEGGEGERELRPA